MLHRIGLFLFFVLLLQSCSNTKFLAEDEKLYTYTWFTERGLEKIRNKPLKAYELYLIGKVKTNRPFILLPRTGLTIYNYCEPSGKWGPRHYIHRIFGKAPVLLQEVNPEFRVKVMKQQLAEMGHFDSDIDLDLKIYGRHQKKARAKYNIYFKPAYTYRNFNFYNQHTRADSIIAASMKESLIRPGDDYWLKIMEDERIRINKVLRNQGHYFFNSDYLLFHADTTVGHKQVDLTMVIKDNIPENAFYKYTIRNVNILVKNNNPKFAPADPDTASIGFYQYISNSNSFRPDIITRHLSVKPDEEYTYINHENTTRYLQGMNAFRSVNIAFEEVDTGRHELDATIELIPLKPIQTNLEVNFATKSNDFLGPAAIASIGHRNIFKGAEQLTLQLDGGFEWQKRSKSKYYELGVNSYEIGSQLKLTIPRFLIPLRLNKQSPRYVPKTYASIGFRSLKRVKYYSINLSQLKFGYTWRNSARTDFKVEPISVDYLKLTKTSAEFDEFLAQYPQVAKSFEEQFIVGSLLSFTYNDNPKKRFLNHYYFNTTLDLAGNLLNGIYNVTGLKEPGSDDPGKLLGTPYSQYTKITGDFRYYFYFTEKTQIATRMLAGVGVPYNNSDVLPYVKQYFAGGSQDLRAFYARSIGPGRYHPENKDEASAFLDQSGEIKLLGSLEYRFPITYKTYGALFGDAGNVWLIKEDPTRPGGKFRFDRFLDDIAIGGGIGIRVDIDYFVIRLDAALPIRKPYIEGAEQWIFNNSGFFNDYIFSLAVGYPF